MKYFICPELFWLVLYSLGLLIEKLNRPPVKSIQTLIESSYIYIPVLLGLSILIYFIPEVVKSGWLIRMWLCGLIGGHLVFDKLLSAHSVQSPGIGMVYISGMIFLFIVLIAGTIFIKIKTTVG